VALIYLLEKHLLGVFVRNVLDHYGGSCVFQVEDVIEIQFELAQVFLLLASFFVASLVLLLLQRLLFFLGALRRTMVRKAGVTFR